MAVAVIAPQLAFDPSMAHEIRPDEPRIDYLRRLLEVVPRDGSWVMEPKLDGWRWQTHVLATEPGYPNWVKSIGGRNGKPHVTPAAIEHVLRALPAGTILDGELVTSGLSSDVGRLDMRDQQKYVVFDVLAFDGYDTTCHPWADRRGLLEGMCPDFLMRDAGGPIAITPVSDVDEQVLLDWIEAGIEGAVCKRRDAPYRPGSRRRDGFVKIKPKQTTDAIVTGWVYGKGQSNTTDCGALRVTLCETGQPTTVAFESSPNQAEKMIGRRIEVQHWGWQASGKVRHPGFVRLRPDMEPAS